MYFSQFPELEHLQKALLELHSKLQDGKVKLEWQRIERQQLQEHIQRKQQDLVLLQKEVMALQMNNSRWAKAGGNLLKKGIEKKGGLFSLPGSYGIPY